MVHLPISSYFPQYSTHCYAILFSNIIYVLINQRPCSLQFASSTSLDCLVCFSLTVFATAYICLQLQSKFLKGSSHSSFLLETLCPPHSELLGGKAAKVEGGCSVLLLSLHLPHKHPCLLKCKMSSVSWTFSLVTRVGRWMFLGLTCSSMLICKGVSMRP